MAWPVSHQPTASRATPHSVYDQPGAVSVQACFDQVLQSMADNLAAMAAHLTGKLLSESGRAATDPGLVRWSGLVKGPYGLFGLGEGDGEASAWICRMLLLSLWSVSVRAWW